MGAWCQSVHLIGGWVDAAELCQREQVLARGVDAHAVEESPVLRLEGVAQRQHVEFQVVATLQEVVTHHGVGRAGNGEVLGIGLLQAVAGEVAGSVIEVVDVEDVVEEGSAEEQGKVEILIAEVVTRRERELRHTVAHHAAVLIAGLRGADDVAILVVDKPFALSSMTGIFPHIEITERLAFLNALQVVEGIGILGAGNVVEVLANVL